MGKRYTDQQLIHAIKQKGKFLEEAMRYLYYNEAYKNTFAFFVRQHNGSAEDIADIFQEGLFILMQKIQNNSFRGESSVQTYFGAICRNLWLSRNSRERRRAEIRLTLTPATITEDTNESILLKKEKEHIFQAILAQLGDGCKQVLALTKLGFTMKEIAQRTNYKNENVIKKKKRTCLHKLRTFLLGRPDLVAIINNKE